MSSTVTCGRYISAFRAADNLIYYVLFEKTYESNVSPRTPSWSCIYFGLLEGAVANIFGRASACEGGMLKNRNGRITPEGYIAQWLREIAAPHEMSRSDIILVKSRSCFSNTVTDETLEPIADRLTAVGLNAEAATLRAGERVSLSLHANAAFFSSLIIDGVTWPWTFIDKYEPERNKPFAPDLGYRPNPASDYSITIPTARRINAEGVIMPDENGNWRYAGWDYRVVGEFIENLWKTEMAEPKSYNTRIKAFRDAIKKAPELPSGSTAVVRPLDKEESYQKSRREDFIQKYPNEPFENGIITAATPESIADLIYLPPYMVTWILDPSLAT